MSPVVSELDQLEAHLARIGARVVDHLNPGMTIPTTIAADEFANVDAADGLMLTIPQGLRDLYAWRNGTDNINAHGTNVSRQVCTMPRMMGS